MDKSLIPFSIVSRLLSLILRGGLLWFELDGIKKRNGMGKRRFMIHTCWLRLNESEAKAPNIRIRKNGSGLGKIKETIRGQHQKNGVPSLPNQRQRRVKEKNISADLHQQTPKCPLHVNKTACRHWYPAAMTPMIHWRPPCRVVAAQAWGANVDAQIGDLPN